MRRPHGRPPADPELLKPTRTGEEMTRSQDTERCASPRCQRILTGKTVVVARDGRRFCKHHGDRLPARLRRTRPYGKTKTEEEQ
jgi:hypothetical protein